MNEVIPNNWQSISLEECCSLITDGSHFSPVPKERGYIIANVRDMRDGYIDLENCKRISKADFELLQANNCSPDHGDILFSKDGSIGKVIVYKQLKRIVLLSSIAILRPNDKVVSEYLGHFLKSNAFTRQVNQLLSGSALRRIVLRDISKLDILLPPYLEQISIAEVLDTLDEVIRYTEQGIEKLKQIKQGLLNDLLKCGLDENYQLRDHTKSEVFKTTELGIIPISWDIKRIDRISSLVTKGTTPTTYGYQYKETGVRFYRVQNIDNDLELMSDGVLFIDDDTNNFLGRSKLESGDVLVTIAGTIGRIGIVSDHDLPGNLNQAIAIIRTRKTEILPLFLALYLSSEQGQKSMLLDTVQLAQANLSLGQILNTLVPVPELSEQRRIVSKTEILKSRILSEKEELEKLKKIRLGLMDDLLTGKVRVTVTV